MYGNQNTTFSTCEYRIFPTKRAETWQLTARFDQEDAGVQHVSQYSKRCIQPRRR